MKYLGVDRSGYIYRYFRKPKWNEADGWWGQGGGSSLIPDGILPSLSPCCLYRIDEDFYTLIGDRRLK